MFNFNIYFLLFFVSEPFFLPKGATKKVRVSMSELTWRIEDTRLLLNFVNKHVNLYYIILSYLEWGVREYLPRNNEFVALMTKYCKDYIAWSKPIKLEHQSTEEERKQSCDLVCQKIKDNHGVMFSDQIVPWFICFHEESYHTLKIIETVVKNDSWNIGDHHKIDVARILRRHGKYELLDSLFDKGYFNTDRIGHVNFRFIVDIITDKRVRKFTEPLLIGLMTELNVNLNLGKNDYNSYKVDNFLTSLIKELTRDEWIIDSGVLYSLSTNPKKTVARVADAIVYLFNIPVIQNNVSHFDDTVFDYLVNDNSIMSRALWNYYGDNPWDPPEKHAALIS